MATQYLDREGVQLLWKEVVKKSDKHFVYVKAVASDTWNIEHNLNKSCNIMAYDDNGNEIMGDIIFVDDNHITLKFSSAIKGKAVLS